MYILKVQGTLTTALNAQINCAHAFAAGVCSRSRQSNFKVKLLYLKTHII